MPFISFKVPKHKDKRKKLPPPSAWGHYRVRREKSAAGRYVNTAKKEGRVLISAKDVVLAYEGRAVVKSLSFDIREGNYISVIGDNGTGKSTLLSALLGLKKISGGRLDHFCLEKRDIGILPQQNDTRPDFPVTVFEVVLTGCLGRGSTTVIPSKQAKKIAFANMERMGITPLSGMQFGRLSGGQKQRVMLARALCAAEKLLVLDEPVTGLDPKTTADIYSLVEDLNKSGGVTVLEVTHDIPSALKYSTHILRLSGEGCFFGTVEEFLALPEAEQYREMSEAEDDIPYGDGGFRYSGGAL